MINIRLGSILLITVVTLAGCAATRKGVDTVCPVDQEKITELASSEVSLIRRHSTGSHTTWTTLQSFSPRLQFVTNQTGSDIWETTRGAMALPLHLDEPRVQKQVKWLARNDQYLNRLASRAALFYHHILHQVIDRGLPAELALLPAIESAYDPKAKSSAGALGLWQFMPATATQYGLKDNWWFDGRRDVLSSTDAALTYLEYLRDYFNGDWLLAIAAYNAGEGRVQRAIEKNRAKNRPTDFWSLELPEETLAYVPKLLALSELVRRPSRYDLELAPVADTPYFEVVDTVTQIELKKAAQLSGVDIEEIYDLNPGYRRWATDPDGPYTLLLPLVGAQQYRLSLSSEQKGEQVTWRRYSVVKGDTISNLAKRFDSNIRSIQRSNNLQSVTLSVGQVLMIPTEISIPDKLAVAPERLAEERQADVPLEQDQLKSYTLQDGETLWAVSKRFGVTTDELALWNGFDVLGLVSSGDEILVAERGEKRVTNSNTAIALAAEAPQKAPPKVVQSIDVSPNMMLDSPQHVIQAGENLYRISLKYGVKLDQLLEWNGLTRDSVIVPGQTLRVPQ